MDFTNVIQALGVADLISALLAIAVVKMTVDVALWAYYEIELWFGWGWEDQDPDEGQS